MDGNEDLIIGARIKEQRKRLELSLEDLAKRTGLTKSFLSQVERGIVSTSLNSLRKIAEALSVSILYFLNETTNQDPVLRAGNRPQINLPGLSDIIYEIITPNLGQKVEIFQGKLKPGKAYAARPLRVPTDECIYVLSGILRICLEHQEHILYTGDSITFEGISSKLFACGSDEEDTDWLWIMTPPAF